MPLTPEVWLSRFTVQNGLSEDAQDPDITQLSNGNVLITWTSSDESSPTDDAGTDIRGQIFDPFGTEIGGEIQLNRSRFADDEFLPSITAIDGGGFAVAYLDFDTIAGPPFQFNSSIVVDVFGASGNFIRGEDLDVGANTPAGFTAIAPVIASSSSTSTFTVWIDIVNGDVQGRSFNPETGAIGVTRTLFNGIAGTDEGINSLAITALDNGNYAVLWGDDNPGNDVVRLQIVDSTGADVGATIGVLTSADVNDVAITTLSSGRLLIAYTVDASGGTDNGIRSKILNEDGTSFSASIATATTVAGNQVGASVVALNDGGGIVFWFDEDTFDLHGQRISATGTKVGSEFDIVDFGATNISNINATLLEDGRVQVVWQEEFTPDDIRSAIIDTRDNANSPDSNGLVVGTIGNDIFDVEAGAVDIYGFAGNDRISFGADEVNPAATIDGGDGTDVLLIEDGAAGNWSFTGETVRNFEEIEFEATADDVARTASFFAEQLDGITRFDFDGGINSEETLQIFMGARTTIDLSAVTVEGFSAADDIIRILGDTSSETITGSSVNDFISGSTGADTINAGDGDDILVVTQDGATNVYNGGTGLDTLDFSGYGAVVSLSLNSTQASGSFSTGGTTSNFTGIRNLIGSGEDDILRGLGVVQGGGGNDFLRGNGDNLVEGGAGDDTLRLDEIDGTPDFDGGADTDQFDAAFLNDVAMYVELDAGYRKGVTTSGTFDGTLTNIENYRGDTNIDVVFGTSDANVIETGAGDDTVNGEGGNDTIFGGDGDDFITGGIGFDDLAGGGDNDTFVYSAGQGIDNIDGGDGIDSFVALFATENMRIDLDDGTQEYNNDGFERSFRFMENVTTGGGNDTVNGYANNQFIGFTFNVGGGNDTVQGGNNEETIFGGDGDDVLYGGGQADEIYGGNNNDTIDGGAAVDTLFGGQGDDTFLATDNNADDIDGGTGVNTLDATGVANNGIDAVLEISWSVNGSTGTLTNVSVVLGSQQDDFISAALATSDVSLNGNGGDDSLFGSTGNDTLLGGTENDTIQGLDGADMIYGGTGAQDQAEYDNSSAAVTIDLAAGTGSGGHAEGDTLSGIERVGGSTFKDRLFGDAGDNVLFGNADDDILRGNAGADSLNGGSGEDFAVYVNSDAAVTVDLAAGTASGGHAAGDTLFSIEKLSGSAFNDRLFGDDDDNVLRGNGGNDVLRGNGGADGLVGGSGLDWSVYVNSDAAVTIDLDAGTGSGGHAAGDTLFNIERVSGSAFNDRLFGDDGDNLLRGNGGNDILRGNDGADTLFGGSGEDWAVYVNSDAGVTVSLASGSASGGHAAGDTFSSIERLSGSNGFGDTLIGNTADNVLRGNGGDDILRGNEGADILSGGSGEDFAVYVNSDAAVTIDLTAGTASGGHANGDSLSSIERLSGSAFNDRLFGDAGDNVLRGNGGNDLLRGEAGADALIGGSGSDWAIYVNSTAGVVVNLGTGAASGGHATGDTFSSIERVSGSSTFDDDISGNSAANILRGNGGDDTLNGARGDDTLLGGSGDDTFVFDANWGSDRITDFDVAGGDVLDFTSLGIAQSDLSISTGASSTTITFAGNSLLLVGVTDTLLASEFDF